MLGMKTYTRAYVGARRARVESDLAAFKTLKANERFEVSYFNNMVLLLDYFFVHRLRGLEGKDGNALNEVRMLCNSMLENEGILMADKSIKLSPEKSILKYRPGDAIKVRREDFEKLSKAFFTEIERRYL